MTFMPAELPTGLVTGRYAFVTVDDPKDADYDPDMIPVTGDVTFTISAQPPIRYDGPNGYVGTIPVRVKAFFDSEGYLVAGDGRGIELPATDSPLFNPTGFTWQVSFNLRDAKGNTKVHVPGFSFNVPEGAGLDGVTPAVDLVAVTPVGSSNGTLITQGAEGDSAYEVAVANGFVGTESEWLATLEGPQGPQGEPGIVDDGSMAAVVADDTSQTHAELAADFAANSRTGTRAVGQGELMLNVADLGASPSATATVNRAALQEAIDTATTFGVKIHTPPGQYETDGPLLIGASPVNMTAGPMGAAEIRCSTGNALEFTATNIGSRFEGMYFIALNGAGHVLKVNDGVSVTRAKFDHCHFWQVGTANIISITGTGAMYDSTFDTCHLRRRVVAGMSAGVHVSVAGTYFNTNMFINTRCEDTAHGATAPFFDLASTGASQYLSGNKWVGLDMAKVDGGYFKMAGMRGNTFDTVVGYDSGTVTADPFSLTDSAHNVFINCDRRGGTLATGIYDIRLTSTCEATTVLGVGAGNNLSYHFADSTVSVVGDMPRATMLGTARTTHVSGGQVSLAGVPIQSGADEPEGVAVAPTGGVYMRTAGAATGRLYYKESGTGNTGWRSSSQAPAQPGTNIADAAHPINTASKAAGRCVFDTTTSRPVWAIGGAATSPWAFADGTTAYSPA